MLAQPYKLFGYQQTRHVEFELISLWITPVLYQLMAKTFTFSLQAIPIYGNNIVLKTFYVSYQYMDQFSFSNDC